MPAGIGYTIGRAIKGSLRASPAAASAITRRGSTMAEGFFGQGMMSRVSGAAGMGVGAAARRGAMYGGAYGGVSSFFDEQKSFLGGIMGGAVMGAGLGAGIKMGATAYGRGLSRGFSNKVRGSASMGTGRAGRSLGNSTSFVGNLSGSLSQRNYMFG